MKFEWRDIALSTGWSLAHSVTVNRKKWHKSTTLTKNDVEALSGLGIKSVQVFQLSPDDLNEDEASETAANHICGKGLKIIPSGRGRANLVALTDGLFKPGSAIDNINMLDDAFSAASLPPYTAVHSGQLVATIKVVPYAVPKTALTEMFKQRETAELYPFKQLKAATIVTGNDIADKVKNTLEHRLNRVNSNIETYTTVAHTLLAVTAALNSLKCSDADFILLLGVSAISDYRDVIPAALEAANGTIIKLGMPTDPGNLLMLGKLQGKYVIGLPGCARSPALNGLDFILERIAAGISLDHRTITLMGTGGLLKEMPERRVPRSPQVKNTEAISITPIVLAAGKASRAKGISKLLSKIRDRSVLETTIMNISKHAKSEIHVVTGHNASALQGVLSALNVTIVHNTEYTNGMGTSLAAGIINLKSKPSYAMICLADMPFVQSGTYKKLTQAAQQAHEGAILIPTFHGKRGHPVLWHQKHFRDLATLHSDVGGKQIIQKSQEYVVEVPVDDAGILIDLDTPEMLEQFGVTPIDQ